MNIYADCNATTAIADCALVAMKPFLERCYGNASSTFHSLGKEAFDALEHARHQLASLLDTKAEQVLFTSGGTESCLNAFLGVLRQRIQNNSNISKIIITAVEHPAVQESAVLLSELCGVETITIGVDSLGELDFKSLEDSLRSNPGALLSVMYANNESGIFFPIEKIVALARAHGATIHCDATQAVGKVPISFAGIGVDMLSLSAHKFGGPKGVGALLLRPDCQWSPVMPGGGQEFGKRGGTQAVAQIVGLGAAAAYRQELLKGDFVEKSQKIRDSFEQSLRSKIAEVEFHGELLEKTSAKAITRLPNTSSVYIPNVNAIEVRNQLAQSGIVVSTGSACASSHTSASPTLLAMGRTATECVSVFRVSFGLEHSLEDATTIAEELAKLSIADRDLRRVELDSLIK